MHRKQARNTMESNQFSRKSSQRNKDGEYLRKQVEIQDAENADDDEYEDMDV